MSFLSSIPGSKPTQGLLQTGAASSAQLLRIQQQFQTQPQQSSPRPAAGSLIIQDSFQPSEKLTSEGMPTRPHGESVTHSAVYDGFDGPVIKRELEGAQGFEQSNRGRYNLENVKLTQPQALASIQNVVDGDTSGLLQQQSQMLDKSTAEGARNTVTNISQGGGKAIATESLFDGAFRKAYSKDPAEQRQGTNTILNYATAFGLDGQKLFSNDPKVQGPERQKLQQNLANVAGDVVDNSPRIAAGKKQFKASVQRYEAGNNSVVISAGNQGNHEKLLEGWNHGLNIDVPADFDKNVLVNDQVTTVGATRWHNNDGQLTEKKAAYSSESGGADIYASGSIDYDRNQKTDGTGTSYASPRVAATMAKLHKDHPDMSSSQIENLMKQSLTHDLNTSSGSISVLDYGKSFEYLKNGTF